ESRTICTRSEAFVILQTVELAGTKSSGSHRGFDDDFNNSGSEPDDVVHDGAQLLIQIGSKRGRSPARQNTRNDWVALFCTRHRLNDVPRKRWMQTAEEADRASVFSQRHQHTRRGWFRNSLRFDDIAFFIDRLKPLAVEKNVIRIFAAENGVRLRARRDQ